MEIKNWIHPANLITITEGQEDSTHFIQAYTDGSKHEAAVGSGIVVFASSNLMTTLRYRLNDRCTNNQDEQLAILKALQYVQNLKEEEKTALVYTDSRITLQLLQNHTHHTYLIDQIRNKVIDMEQNEWKVELSWIKANVGQRGD
jgi:ribonuclease HI